MNDASAIPPLQWEEFYWTGSIQLPIWKEFFRHNEPYFEKAGGKPEGGISLCIHTPGEMQVPPSIGQTAAYKYLLAHQATIRDAIVNAVFNEYPKLQEGYNYQGLAEEFPNDFDEDTINELMPAIQSPEDLNRLMGLGTVYILPVAQNGISYIGFEFNCTWDVEHGLGVLMHQERVVEVEADDFSFIAQQDVNAKGE